MKIERLTRKDALEAMNTWIGSSFTLPKLGKEYSQIREDLIELYNDTKDSIEDSIKSYEMDVCFGAALYDYFKTKQWFTERLASDDGFWRYLSLKVVPDLIGERWGNDNADHYYTKPSRIWLKCMWWYIHLSLNSTTESTKGMLMSKNFSTDTILNLVERTGRGGTNIQVYRTIISLYNKLDDVSDKDFRKIMKLNTAKAMVIEPVLCEGGIKGYVSSIFKELSLI